MQINTIAANTKDASSCVHCIAVSIYHSTSTLLTRLVSRIRCRINTSQIHSDPFGVFEYSWSVTECHWVKIIRSTAAPNTTIHCYTRDWSVSKCRCTILFIHMIIKFKLAMIRVFDVSYVQWWSCREWLKLNHLCAWCHIKQMHHDLCTLNSLSSLLQYRYGIASVTNKKQHLNFKAQSRPTGAQYFS